MGNPLSNKKKIRGWKRRVKQIDQWKLRYIELNMGQLKANQRDYVKLWIDPFYRLTRRNPPVWFFRLLLAAMVEVYHSWHQTLKQLDEPFYLKIWLYHPNFIQSQIVAAFRECLHFYDHTFDENNESKAFPIHIFRNTDALDQFKWELYKDSDYYWLSQLQEDIELGWRTEKEIEAIKAKAYHLESVELGNGMDTLLHVKVGDVWLGEIRYDGTKPL